MVDKIVAMSTIRTILGMSLALRRLRSRESWTRPQITAHQNKSLAQLRSHAYARSPFYREFHSGLTDRPLNELPILTKSLLRNQFDRIVTDPAVNLATTAAHAQAIRGAERLLDKYVVNTTSGTTGESTYILYNRAEWATVLASFSRFELHIGSIGGMIRRPRMAIVASSAPWHMSALVGTTVRSGVLPILRLDVGAPIDSIVQQLNAQQPHIVATYATMAGILANEQTAKRLQIAPQRIVCTAEVLSSTLRQRIQTVWGDIVFNQYGATEGGAFAVECNSPYHVSNRHEGHARGMHLFEDLFVLEVVDRENQPVPPGQYGDKVLLTVLFNHTQPLIRYELSDRLRMATVPCSCGRALALIADVQGREEEVLRFPGRTGGTTAVHPMVFYRILDATSVRSWQVVQDGSTLYLRLTGDAGGIQEQALVNDVRAALDHQSVVPPAIVVQWPAEAERSLSGKAARIMSRRRDRPT